MLAMGLTLELKEFLGVFKQRLFAILFGCLAQYTIMPAFGAIVSKALGLQASLSVGDVDRSRRRAIIHSDDCLHTLAAVLFTPLLTKILAGAYIPVDAAKLSISTLQVVVAPIL
ncbi:Sodium/pyruvate cotransporter BASS2, chloroplastic [Apostasia shenzhenica]|uniref:Sodium/pyruvate cotransporter BASS2, chloroplastic n=1 Tax=Apostasia shenzhenica TaxID=1088818 RepID=A0A2I0B3Z2_9ASPA|nr:Sodium/pyruvate cotransporter BASS2, chloroplastic [Apostasia shenzhenica]